VNDGCGAPEQLELLLDLEVEHFKGGVGFGHFFCVVDVVDGQHALGDVEVLAGLRF